MTNNRSTEITEAAASILRLVLGDPKSRVPKLLITIGAGAMLSQWWLPLVYALAIKYFQLPSELMHNAEVTSFWVGVVFVLLGIAGWVWQMSASAVTSEPAAPLLGNPVNSQLQRPNPDGQFGVLKVLPEDGRGGPNGEADTPELAFRLAKMLAGKYKTAYHIHLMNHEGAFTQDLGIVRPEAKDE